MLDTFDEQRLEGAARDGHDRIHFHDRVPALQRTLPRDHWDMLAVGEYMREAFILSSEGQQQSCPRHELDRVLVRRGGLPAS